VSVAADPLPYEALGQPIRGPQALSDDWARFWHLTFNIARTQWKMRFFGSVLGYFWQLIRPLLLFGVLYVFFTKIGHVGQGATAQPGEPEHF
jgi:ABC-2 type transport system permease protein